MLNVRSVSWHSSIGRPRTGMFGHRAGALVHIGVERLVDRNHHLYATLQTLGCNLWDTTQRERLSAQTEMLGIMFFDIELVGVF